MPIRRVASTFLVLALAASFCQAQRKLGVRPTSSGGVLSPEQAAYDVRAYRMELSVDPEEKSIEGSLSVEADIVHPVAWLVLDLDHPLRVERAFLLDAAGDAMRELEAERRQAQVWVAFPGTRQPGEHVKVRLEYGGKPREAPRPPWVGGFVWSQTPSGEHWIAVACQVDGADLWWPVKDHPSDEPDEMDLRITVPEPLIVASNGTLQGVSEGPNGMRTFHWHVANPINVYNVTLNIAPYETIEGTYRSIGGEDVPMTLWVLPESLEEGRGLFEQMPKHLRFLEETVGPYPFRSEKYGVAHTPYLGMEHQTIIAYGSDFSNNEHGFDWLHFHELGHEWWGNLVSAYDWNAYWIHEGFCSYMEALYAEKLGGAEALRRWMKAIRPRLRNLQPVAPREALSTVEKYFVPPDFTESDGDVNFKGSWILHTLRYVIGDEDFMEMIKRVAYPTREMEGFTDGRQCHFATTRDVRHTAERISGQELGWFFEVYLRQPRLPELIQERGGQRLDLRWEVPGGLPFPMPVEVEIDGRLRRVEMDRGQGSIEVPAGAEVRIDPGGWILRVR